MQKEIYNLTVEPITCVHVGTGNTLTPLDYNVAKTTQGNRVFAKYSWDKLLSRMEGDQKMTTAFMRASDSGNMKELHKFFKENWKPSELEYICQATREFLARCDKSLVGDPLDNAMEVHEMYRTAGKFAPTIPGSSIKGAMRTAVLNHLLVKLDQGAYDSLQKNFDDEPKKAKFDMELQKSLLGYNNAKNDPFRAVEITDCKFKPAGTQLVGMVKNISRNKHLNDLQSTSMQVIAEVLKGKMLMPDIKGVCQIRINLDLQRQKKTIRRAISARDIVESCNDFFAGEFYNEYEKFYKDLITEKAAYIEKLPQIIEQIERSKDSFVLRVGRWSQVEFVTYEESFRNPKTPPGKGWGETRFVFDNDGKYLPLGWCKCTLKKAGAAEANQ